MKSFLLPLTSSISLMAALQCSAAEAGMPDCVGLRPGMSITEARERLKAYDAKLEVRDLELQIPSLGDNSVVERLFLVQKPAPSPRGVANNTAVLVPYSDPTEILQAEITLPPSKPVVWKVVRSLHFEKGKEQTRTALFAALGEKYGKESFTTDQGIGPISRYWVRDPQGNLLEGRAAEECYYSCQPCKNWSVDAGLCVELAGKTEKLERLATPHYTNMIELIRPVFENSPCQTMTYVIAELGVRANRELVNRMQITVLDGGLGTRSREATRALIKQSETATQKGQVERATQQPVPKL